MQVNPQYESTFVFDNDFPALQPDAPEPGKNALHRSAWSSTGLLACLVGQPSAPTSQGNELSGRFQ